MSPEFPPRPSKRTTIALAAVALLTFLYSILLAGQILLWFVLVGIAIGLYLTYLLIVAVFRLVGAVERIATAAEVDSGIRDASDVDPRTADRDAADRRAGIGDDSAGTDATVEPADADATVEPADASDAAGRAETDDPDTAPESGSDGDPDER